MKALTIVAQHYMYIHYTIVETVIIIVYKFTGSIYPHTMTVLLYSGTPLSWTGVILYVCVCM